MIHVREDIKWNADNSKHYRYAEDGMASMAWLDDEEENLTKTIEQFTDGLARSN